MRHGAAPHSAQHRNATHRIRCEGTFTRPLTVTDVLRVVGSCSKVRSITAKDPTFVTSTTRPTASASQIRPISGFDTSTTSTTSGRCAAAYLLCFQFSVSLLCNNFLLLSVEKLRVVTIGYHIRRRFGGGNAASRVCTFVSRISREESWTCCQEIWGN